MIATVLLICLQVNEFEPDGRIPKPNIEIEVGDGPKAAKRVELVSTGVPDLSHDERRIVFHFKANDGSILADVTVERDQEWPITHKSAQITNNSKTPVRLLNLILDRFPVGSAKTEGGDRGFPLYLDKKHFLSIAHPAGFAHVEGKDVVLRQYPGIKLPPRGMFQSMEAIYGTSKPGQARALFVDYVRSRMARVIYGQDKPYAILESFGGEPDGNFKYEFTTGVSENYLVKHLAEIETSKKNNGVQFDYYGLEFWQDRAGDLTQFNHTNFPNGFGNVRDRILDIGMQPALWIDSGNLPEWSIDLNPATALSRTIRNGVGGFCRASEPIASIYRNAYLYQMRENKAGLFKFDNLAANCVNPTHDHLPGPLYSTEAIYNGLIDFFSDLRRANPKVFIMLYWGYRSPWWLQYGDTYFECGDQIEAASPAQYPTPYARDAVTQRLDQAQLKITDTPWLGKDSLGVWLSDWMWNSSIGKARWQEGTIMDMARGGLLFQLWTDANWLTPPERDQVATFIKLLKANSNCFDHSRFIIGDPNKAEPYGYSCCDGKKAFLAINNACMSDRTVQLDLGPKCGLPGNGQWDIYRWYPNPVRLTKGSGPPDRMTSIALRPYEVVLLEVVPAGQSPSLGRHFPTEENKTEFAESSRILPVTVHIQPSDQGNAGIWTPMKPYSATSRNGAKLVIRRDASVLASGPNGSNDTYTVEVKADSGVSGILLETLTDPSLPSNGPGRAVNGNFALTKVRIHTSAIGANGEPTELNIRNAAADFSQTSYGGWPIAAAIDDDPKTGWSIHPEVGQLHAAVFTLDRPINHPCLLTITLVQGQNGHNLGRFRLSATHDAKPALPHQFQRGTVTLTLNLPPTKTGGLLILEGGSTEDTPQAWVEESESTSRTNQALVANFVRSSPTPLPATGDVGEPANRGRKALEQKVRFESVWATKSNWSCPWTAWRSEIAPTSKSRKVTIKFDRPRTKEGVKYTAYFLPR